MNLLDWLLVVLVLAYALSGYWQGFVTGAFATGGAAARRALRRLAGAARARRRRPSLLVSLGALFIVILCRLARPGAAAVRRREDPRPDPLAAGPRPGRGRRRGAERRRGAAGGVGARRGRLRHAASAAITPHGARLDGARRGRPGAAGRRGRGAAGLQRRRRHQLLPALPRAVRARSGSSRSGPGPQRLLSDPDVGRRASQRAQGPRHQRLRPRRRGQRASSTPTTA